MADLSYGSKYAAAAPDMNDEDEFERNLKEMLKDGINVGGTNVPVSNYGQDNSYNGRGLDLGTGTPRTPASSSQNTVPRSYTSPSVSAAATTDIPLSSPGQRSAFSSPSSPTAPNGVGAQPMSAKIESIKEWSVNTLKCTRQFFAEKLGKGSRTVDVELEAQIERLRETQRKYAQILRLARALASHYNNVVTTQRQLGDAFGELAQKSPELMEEFSYNSETQKVLSRNGETLLGALNFFVSSVNTLCNKTMEDTILTIKNYETARLEFDAYKQDYESLKNSPKDGAAVSKVNEARVKFEKHREKFEKLRDDVSVKLKFLEENKVKVMHKQLLLFHNAVSAYFSGNQAALDSTLKQFSIKLHPTTKTSWLEH